MRVFLPFSNPWTLYYQSLWMGCGICLLHFSEMMQFSLILRSQKKPGKTHNVKFSLSLRRKWNSIPLSLLFPHSRPRAPPPEDRVVYRTIDQVRSCAHTLREGKKINQISRVKEIFICSTSRTVPAPHFHMT